MLTNAKNGATERSADHKSCKVELRQHLCTNASRRAPNVLDLRLYCADIRERHGGSGPILLKKSERRDDLDLERRWCASSNEDAGDRVWSGLANLPGSKSNYWAKLSRAKMTKSFSLFLSLLYFPTFSTVSANSRCSPRAANVRPTPLSVHTRSQGLQPAVVNGGLIRCSYANEAAASTELKACRCPTSASPTCNLDRPR